MFLSLRLKLTLIYFSLILLVVLTFVFSQDLFVDISQETEAPSAHNPTVIINLNVEFFYQFI